MAVQVQGNSGVVMGVQGTTFRAGMGYRAPVDYGSLGIYKVSAISGTIAAALAANSEVFQFRWPEASNLALVYRVRVSAAPIAVTTVAAIFGLEMRVARSWTVAGSGGTRLTLTGNNAKLRTSMGTSLVNDAGIATTAALTVGTKTLEAQATGAAVMQLGTLAVTGFGENRILAPTPLFDANGESQMPLVLAQNEGFVIRNPFVGPATMTWSIQVEVVWAEVTTF